MRKYILSLAIIFQFSLAQEAEVTNVTVAQRTDGSGIVDITYDLTEDAVFPSFDVTVSVSLDGGVTYNIIDEFYQPPDEWEQIVLSGDFGPEIFPGTGKQITWEAGIQYPDTFVNDLAVVITATGHVVGELPFDMVSVPAGEYTYGQNDQILMMDHNFDIMKYPVTNAEFVVFLLEEYPSGNGPMDGATRITWNGTTYIVEEGYGNNPAAGFNYYQALSFCEYNSL